MAAEAGPGITGFQRDESPDGGITEQAWKRYNLLSLGGTIFAVGYSDHANHSSGQMAVVSVVIGPF